MALKKVVLWLYVERQGSHTCVFEACVQILLFALYYFPPNFLLRRNVNCYHCDEIILRLFIEHATGYLLYRVVVCK